MLTTELNEAPLHLPYDNIITKINTTGVCMCIYIYIYISLGSIHGKLLGRLGVKHRLLYKWCDPFLRFLSRQRCGFFCSPPPQETALLHPNTNISLLLLLSEGFAFHISKVQFSGYFLYETYHVMCTILPDI